MVDLVGERIFVDRVVIDADRAVSAARPSNQAAMCFIQFLSSRLG
jgi:hypothetical protein